jgi:hypothetical protein
VAEQSSEERPVVLSYLHPVVVAVVVSVVIRAAVQ